jgi:hypothetical protein
VVLGRRRQVLVGTRTYDLAFVGMQQAWLALRDSPSAPKRARGRENPTDGFECSPFQWQLQHASELTTVWANRRIQHQFSKLATGAPGLYASLDLSALGTLWLQGGPERHAKSI